MNKYYEKIKKFIKENKKKLFTIFFLCLFPIVLNGLCRDRYNREVKEAMVNNELKKHKRNSYKGDSFITDTYPIFKDVVIVGDSYSHMVDNYLGFDVTNYSCPGLKLEKLKNVFEVASKSNKKYAVIFIGPNDFIAQTDLSVFYDTLLEYVNMLKNNMKSKVILSTYLPSKYTMIEKERGLLKLSIDMYNEELKKVISIDDDIYYFDLTKFYDIEKHSRYTIENGDMIHFNFDFYVEYINNLYDLIMDIEIEESKK